MRKLLTSGALLMSLSGLGSAGPAQAGGDPGLHHAGRHGPRRSERLLPPEVPYRDPALRRRGRYAQPSFPIQAYLPRHTETPIYNVPPPRF